jgi:CTP:phosphocholine cytidylyltransferase-like protein
MKTKLQKIPVNMQQSVIWTQQPEVTNTICAITHQHRNMIVVMAGFQGILPEIEECAGIENPTILYGDSFFVDTWDYRVKKFLKEYYLKEELKRVISQAFDYTEEEVLEDEEFGALVNTVSAFIQKRES